MSHSLLYSHHFSAATRSGRDGRALGAVRPRDLHSDGSHERLPSPAGIPVASTHGPAAAPAASDPWRWHEDAGKTNG